MLKDSSWSPCNVHKMINSFSVKYLLSFPSYTVFGLGNKTYEHFNAMGRLVDSRLAEMGANRLYKEGEGDDDGR